MGTIGQPIKVLVNYFRVLQFPQQGSVYQYHIAIRNKKEFEIPRAHRRAVYGAWLKRFCQRHPEIDPYKIVFDNQMIILTFNQQLPNIDQNGITENMIGPNRINVLEEYKINIKQVGEPIDLSQLLSLEDFYENNNDDYRKSNGLQNMRQMFSIVLHEYCSSHADFIFNRSFFSLPLAENQHGNWDLGLGKALWRGFYSCLLFTNSKYQLIMNLDIMVHSPCTGGGDNRNRNRRQVEIEHVLKVLDPEINNKRYDNEVAFLLKHCKNLCVRSQVANKTIQYHIHELGASASTQTFEWNKKNNSITVENYYKEQYGIELKYPTLPTLKMRNEAFVPMEIVNVEAVKITKITDEQRALLCLQSFLTPVECHQSIQEVRQNPRQQCFEKDPFVAAWRLNVDVNMPTVSARILPPPDIVYTKWYRVKGNQMRKAGVWKCDTTQFYTPASFPPVWTLINISSLSESTCKTFYDDLCIIAEERGIDIPLPIYEEYRVVQADSINRLIDILKKMMRKNVNCKFFIVILPKDSNLRDQSYADLKKMCELEFGFGIVTQMIKETNALTIKTRGQGQQVYSKLSNILLKINTKLNGINSILNVHPVIKDFFSRGHRIMYVGIDLSHPAPGSGDRRSIAAVVASADNIPNRYFKEVYIQERSSSVRKESIENVVNIKEIMKSLINQYEQRRGYPPNAIVIYRDGISTSEFSTVFEKELTATREACVELSSVYRPRITYIVVNKRHHTRFFPEDLKSNIPAGTVVDSPDVTNPTTYNFFLNSHHGGKGTNRPGHYHVLYDDNKLEPDQVQMLTYALCYTYARCTSSISIPAPVKYADLLAYRARLYLSETNLFESNVNQSIQTTQIRLSPKLAPDSPFFL